MAAGRCIGRVSVCLCMCLCVRVCVCGVHRMHLRGFRRGASDINVAAGLVDLVGQRPKQALPPTLALSLDYCFVSLSLSFIRSCL